ncbi:hypothetical protein ACER0C_025937 [Sarotherodon galilaeus]
MAPLCVARRLSLPLLCLFVLFFIARVNFLLMYNRQTLLDLRLVVNDLTNATYTGHKTSLLVKPKAYLVRSSPAAWKERGSVPHHVFSPDVPSTVRCEPTEPAAVVSGLTVSHEHADLHQAGVKNCCHTAPSACYNKRRALYLRLISKQKNKARQTEAKDLN